MAIHMYLKLDSITGEASAKSYEEQIEVLSWTWALSQSGSAHHGSGTGTAGVTVGDVSIVKYVDRATPTLMKYCCAGTHFDLAKLTVLKAGSSPTPYLTLELMKGLVTSVNSGGVGPEERLIETVSFNFKAFKIAYVPQKDGKPQAAVPAGWDIPKNCSIA
jgi:type VI secretion system secreted protein Hcp